MASSLLFNEKSNDGCLPDLTFTERILCFGGCFLIGTLINVMSFGSFGQILLGHPERFALTFTLGNIISIMGSTFLVGLKKQYQNMSDTERRYTTITYIVSMLGVLISALAFKSAILVFLFLIVEICSYVWYTASYIPFARDCLKKLFKNCIKK